MRCQRRGGHLDRLTCLSMGRGCPSQGGWTQLVAATVIVGRPLHGSPLTLLSLRLIDLLKEKPRSDGGFLYADSLGSSGRGSL